MGFLFQAPEFAVWSCSAVDVLLSCLALSWLSSVFGLLSTRPVLDGQVVWTEYCGSDSVERGMELDDGNNWVYGLKCFSLF